MHFKLLLFVKMNTPDQLYALALQYRDNKVAGCSAENSLAEAEKRFLELSQEGHSKAMHNYAVLQQKNGRYKLAMEWYTRAGLDASKRNIIAMKICGQIKEDLFLVVANDRSTAGNHGSPVMDPIYGTSVDMSHMKSFGGNATTCDVQQCAIPGAKHIVADALTFDFTKRYNLKHVLIERPPTMNPAKPSESLGVRPVFIDEDTMSGFKSDAQENFVGSMVQNLSKAMEPGAILEIEWDPYTSQLHLSDEELAEYRILNPFHGYINMNAAVLGVQCMHPGFDTDISRFSPETQAMAREYGEKFRTEVAFWHSQGASGSFEETFGRMYAEMKLYAHLMNALDEGKTALFAFVEADVLKDPTEKVVPALQHASCERYPPQVVGHRCKLEDGRWGKVYSPGALVTASLFGMAINSLAVQNNLAYAQRYLESIGFKEVQIERRTNTHNGRNNVWMVTAVKG